MDKLYVIVNNENMFRNKGYRIGWTNNLSSAKLYTLEDAINTVTFISGWNNFRIFNVKINYILGNEVKYD